MLYNLIQAKIKVIEPTNKPSIDGIKQKHKSANIEKLLAKCRGDIKPMPQFILADLNVNGRIKSYNDSKNILIQLFKLKPYEFSGITRNVNKKNFSFLMTYEAFVNYKKESPHIEAGNITPWCCDDLFKQSCLAMAISTQIVSRNPSNKGFKKAAKHLLEHLTNNYAANASNFIYKGSLVPDDQVYLP